MKIYGSPYYQSIFFNTFYPKIQKTIPNWRRYAPQELYLGVNPTSGKGINQKRPHTSPNGKVVVMPQLPIYEVMAGERGLKTQILLIGHEYGHCVHLQCNNIDWENWAWHTGRKLDLREQWQGNYWYIPAYEQFAGDMYRMINAENLGYFYQKLFNLTW